MSRIDWIVCERTSRWVSALRLAIAADDAAPRVRELRHLTELDAELHARPTALAAIEIHRGNFAQLLAWLPTARGRHTSACSIALVDRSLTDELDQVTAALLEAGAQAIATSPRRLGAILSLGQEHARIAGISGPNTPLHEAVWASLPWQAE